MQHFKHLKRLLPLLCILAACNAPPKFEHRSPAGVAHANSESVARMIAMTANIYAAQVCAVLRVEQTPPFVIRQSPRRAAAGLLVERDSAGNVLARHIEIGDQALDTCPRFLIAHELVHWYASAPWDRLPHAIEEGLADYIALQLAPEFHAERVVELERRLVSITPERRALALGIAERTWASATYEARSDAYAIGFEVVQRFGVEGLRTLCERAQREGHERVPLAWIEGAGLPPYVAASR